MTSKPTSSNSPKTNGQEPMTYERLLAEPKKLRQVAYLLGSQGWEAMELWLQAERQVHLESLVDEDDPQKREAHRAIAKWINYFTTTAKDHLEDTDYAQRHPEPLSEPDPMPYDSEGQVPPGTENH